MFFLSDITSDRSPIEDRQLSNESVSSAESVAGTIHLTEHSTYARRKLDELQERHNNKIQVSHNPELRNIFERVVGRGSSRP